MQKILILGIIILLFIGVNVLASFAWNIEGKDASFFQTLLPAFYILTPLFFFKLFSANLMLFYQRKKEEFNLLFFFLLIIIIKIYWGHAGFLTAILNALFLPVIISGLMPIRKYKKTFYVNRNFRDIVQKIIICFFIVECTIAIAEKIFLINLFPINISDNSYGAFLNRVEISEFRSTALVNHPLQNALSVSIIMSFILISTIKDSYKYILWALGYLAILCFNTRGSIVMWIIFFLVFVVYTVFINRKVSIKSKWFLILISLFIITSLFYMVFGYGWGGRILNMGLLGEDDGSSAVRVKIWDVFETNNWQYFLVGHDYFEIARMAKKVDVEIIENYWLILVFTYGFILTIGIIYLFSKLLKRILTGYSFFSKVFVLSCFLLISSTNNSLVVPSPALAIFIICCYIFNQKTYNTNKKITI